MLTKQKNLKNIQQEVFTQARLEDSPNIRAVLDALIARAQEQYNSTTVDHRYLQGALHSLEGFRGQIKQP